MCARTYPYICRVLCPALYSTICFSFSFSSSDTLSHILPDVFLEKCLQNMSAPTP
ncbi:hypothetical protein BDZ91DRAFT_743098 [Kalaharituber pfeilii]|nr:hypothetical protein BDZ91DRAFT_743098 [Kalaharituber pfeilii]